MLFNKYIVDILIFYVCLGSHYFFYFYRQESVDKGVYQAGEFDVTTDDGRKLTVSAIYRSEPPTEGARPSPQYKKVSYY